MNISFLILVDHACPCPHAMRGNHLQTCHVGSMFPIDKSLCEVDRGSCPLEIANMPCR